MISRAPVSVWLATLFLATLLGSVVAAQDTHPLVDERELHYFDFWSGTWNRVIDGRVDTSATRFVVTRGLHAGAWEERWRQRLDSTTVLHARAFRTWDKTTRRWTYVWVSDNGLFQVWEGRKVGIHWYFYREFDVQGDRYLSRQAWLPAEPGRLVRISERSSDGGGSWQLRFREDYRRMPPLPSSEHHLSPDDAAAVRRVSDEYGRAWLANDTAAVMAVFTDDAVLIPHLGNPQAVGKAAIRDHFWPPGSPPAPVIAFERQSIEVRGSGDVAWDRGTYRLAFVYGADTLGNRGNYLAVAVRGADDRWRWSAYTWNHR